MLGCSLKNDRMISLHFQGKPFNITVIQIYAQTTNAKEAEVEPSRTIAKGDVLFTPGDWNVKVGSQEISGVTGKFGYEVQNEAW